MVDGSVQYLQVVRAHLSLVHARRLGIAPPPRTTELLDVLELFAFVRPARFCAPSPTGLALAMGQAEPKGAEAQATALRAAADTLLRELAELTGLPVVTTLSELTEDALVQILTEPKNAVVKQFSRLLSMEGAELEVRPAALKAIARKALARKTGARGLRSILENALIDTMFELPGMSNVEKVVVDESTIDENKPPLLVYREAAKQA